MAQAVAAKPTFTIKTIENSHPHYHQNIGLVNPKEFETLSNQLPEKKLGEKTKSKVEKLLKNKPTSIFVCILNAYVFEIIDPNVEAHQIWLSPGQIKTIRKKENDEIILKAFDPPRKMKYTSLNLCIFLANPNPQVSFEVDAREIQKHLKAEFRGQIFTGGQWINFVQNNTEYRAVVSSGETQNPKHTQGKLGKKTVVRVSAYQDSELKVNHMEDEIRPIWKGDIDLSDFDDLNERLEYLKLGGMTLLVKNILNKAFASRLLSTSVAERSDMIHPRGMLLYGPPGSGKTFLAKKLCKLLDSVEPKVVKGPELKDKYFGEPDRKLREVFAPAVRDFKMYGNNSRLHVIIFDELDSFTPSRSGDSVTNRMEESMLSSLLVALHSISSFNNIFVFGTTNRRDMIDGALLRKGRIGLEFEVGYPDEANRLGMLKVIFRAWEEDGRLDEDVKMEELAALTDRCVPASLGSLLSTTHSCALERNAFSCFNLKYKRADFVAAIAELPRKPEITTQSSTTTTDQVNKVNLEMRSLRTKINEVDAQVNSIKEESITELTQRVQELDGLVRNGDQLQALDVRLETAEQKLLSVDGIKDELNSKLEAVTKQVEALKEKLGSLEGQGSGPAAT